MAIVIFLLVVAGGGALAAALWPKPKQKQLGETALAMGDLPERIGASRTRHGFTGNIDGFHVTVSGTRAAVEITVGGRHRFPSWLVVVPSAAQHAPPRPHGWIETHDRYFDEAFHVSGPEAATIGLLSGSLRSQLGGLRGFRVESGVIIVQTMASHESTLELSLRRVLDVATLLAQSQGDTARGLARNAIEDPNSFVRRRNLALLALHFRSADLTEETLIRAIEDPVAENAYFAARTLGGAIGRAYMVKFVAIGKRDSERLEAFLTLIDNEPWPVVLPLLETAVENGSRAVSDRALAWIDERGSDADLIALLSRAPPTTRNLDEIVRRTAKKAKDAVEPKLLRLLEDPAFITLSDVRLACIRALESYGTPKSLATLRALATATVPVNPLAKAARAALDAIGARSGIGGLAIVETATNAGAVSIATGDDGAMSIVDPDDDAA